MNKKVIYAKLKGRASLKLTGIAKSLDSMGAVGFAQGITGVSEEVSPWRFLSTATGSYQGSLRTIAFSAGRGRTGDCMIWYRRKAPRCWRGCGIEDMK
jgi:hypothetical protein